MSSIETLPRTGLHTRLSGQNNGVNEGQRQFGGLEGVFGKSSWRDGDFLQVPGDLLLFLVLEGGDTQDVRGWQVAAWLAPLD